MTRRHSAADERTPAESRDGSRRDRDERVRAGTARHGHEPAPETTEVSEPVRRLHRAVGNAAVQRLATGNAAGGAAAERQAAQAARAIAGSERDGPARDRESGASQSRTVRPPRIDRAPDRADAPLGDVPDGGSTLARRYVRATLASLDERGGRPLPASTATALSATLGVEPRGIRIHTGREAGALARRLNARAVAAGRSLVFDRGEFRPGTAAGDELLAHEAVHAVQQARAGTAVVQRDSHADQVTDRLGLFASSEDAVAALDFLAGLDPGDFDDTVADLAASHDLGGIVHKLGSREQVRRFAHLLAERGSPATKEAVFEAVPMLRLDVESQLVVFGRQFVPDFGARGELPDARQRALRSKLVSGDPGDPFTGMAVRGERPSEAPMTAGQFAGFAAQYIYGKVTGADLSAAKYTKTAGLGMLYEWSNPIKGALMSVGGSPPGYLDTLTATEREEQAQLLFGQEIATAYPEAYGGQLPTRIQVIRTAAKAHDLEPELVAAIILAEQRDQSRREDAADYQAAISTGRSTSIGLGQVTVATATREDLFADLLAPKPAGVSDRAGLVVPQLLASDEFNVFAVARYARQVADIGAGTTLASVPGLNAHFAGTNMAAFGNHSSTWTDDHVRMLGSEYTSSPFQAPHSIGWGEFVLAAYEDVTRAGIF